MQKAILVTIADKEWLTSAKQLFSSVYWNSGWKGDYMLITDDSCPEKDLGWFKNKGIIVKRFPLIKSMHSSSKRIYNISLNKFYLFTPYFRKWEKVVYLDSDIIVTGSLECLLSVNGFGAVSRPSFLKDKTNILKGQFNEHLDGKELSSITRKNYDFSAPAFNDGVFSFSTSLITKNLFSQMSYFFKKTKKFYKFRDQPFFNLFFYGRWENFPVEYNTLVGSFLRKNIFNSVILRSHVLHFNGEDRPWHKGNFFYPLWRKNLLKADSISLGKRIHSKRIPDFTLIKCCFTLYFSGDKNKI